MGHGPTTVLRNIKLGTAAKEKEKKQDKKTKKEGKKKGSRDKGDDDDG